MSTKVCIDCGKIKDIEKFAFRKERNAYRNQCRKCRSLQKSNAFVRKFASKKKKKGLVGKQSRTEFFEDLVIALLKLSRYNMKRLHKITSRHFFEEWKESNDTCKKHNITYKQIEAEAERRLIKTFGLDFDRQNELKPGTYLIVGDSHGTHTQHKTFDLMRNIVKAYNVDSIIHTGHMLDDNNLISYRWKDFNNVIVIPKKEEIRILVQKIESENLGFKLVHEKITVGELDIRNQDYFTNEYTDTSISNLQQKNIQRNIITNFHKHEMHSKNTLRGNYLLYMGIGCLCENFVTSIKRVTDWVGGGQKKEVYTDGYCTSRRREEMKELWERGVVILFVGENNESTPVMIRIYDVTDDECGIGFLNKVVTNKGIYNSDSIDLVTGDMHIPLHDPHTLSIIDSVADKYNFRNHVNLGDVCHNMALNHHAMDKGRVLETMNESFLRETAHTAYVLRQSIEWGRKNYMLYANHERFVEDFFTKYPQLKDTLDIKMLYNLDQLDIELIALKETLEIDNARYAHGDLRPYGIGGKLPDKLSKIFNTYETPMMVGHVHFPSIRAGTYTIGLCGKMDQNYNETTTSQWMHGFGIATNFNSTTWLATIPMLYDRLHMDNNVFESTAPEKWVMKNFKGATVTYDF